MNKRHFKNKEKSPLLIALGILFIVGIIFYLFKKDKKEMPQEPVIPPPSPKDFI
jgi:cbb3-type cytochrome oxidase subunit 3